MKIKGKKINKKGQGILPDLFTWCGPGLNRRHKDFQSFALPTELPHHHPFNWIFPLRGSKNRRFDSKITKLIQQIISLYKKEGSIISLVRLYLLQNDTSHLT